MSQSLTKIVVHAVYSTKDRRPYLSKNVRTQLYPYKIGILDTLGCITLAIGGIDDHVHVLFSLSKTITLSKAMEELKGGASRWLRAEQPDMKNFAWQGGFGAFSVSESQIPKVVEYIENQERHHQVLSFQDELKSLLKKHRIDFDEQYLWT